MPGIKEKKPEKKKFLKFLLLLFSVIFPLLLLILGVFLFQMKRVEREKFEEELTEVGEEVIGPSQILNNRREYTDQRLVIQGRVAQEPITCERKECPKEDRCCGCPEERDLVIYDSGTTKVKETEWRLRLLGPEGQAYCQRRVNSCQYECSGWEINGIYELLGAFRAEPPPLGTAWRLYFDFYFEVEEERLIREAKTDITEIPKRIIQIIQELIQEAKTSGYYVLP